VCADIDDFREMAAGENMAIRFYKKGDAADLAEQFVAILQSPNLQRAMAEHNYEAGKEMTMTSVVKSYLRWFELHKYKRTMRKEALIPELQHLQPSDSRDLGGSSSWSSPWAFLAKRRNEIEVRKVANSAINHLQVEDAGDGFPWSNPRALKDRSNSKGD
jgi:hypothetical protein